MSRRKTQLQYSRAEHRHMAARLPQATESLSAFLWDHLLQRERENKLPWLTPQFATACYEEYRRGDYAQIQLLWDQLEEYDETLATVVAARLGAIAEMPWSIVVDADAVGEYAGLQALANAQQSTLSAEIARVENLEEAIAHLAMADFRGVAALELVQDADTTRWRWEVIEPWCLARPARRGPWMYNAEARSNPSHLEGLDATRTILREARPIDLPAMYLIVAKRHAIEGWDSVLDTFGVPSIFMELPPGTSQEMADYYTALVRRIVGDGRGTIPSGAKFQTVETRQNTTTPFAERAKWCNEGIITLATGGLLTVSTEAGSGTLAGNAHADSLARLCALTARSISSCINRQWVRRILEAQYPGQPVLARFELAPEQEEDTTAMVQQLATLAGAGWRPSDETVSEMLGYPLRSIDKEVKLESTTELAPIINRRGADAAAGIFPGEFDEEVEQPAPGVLEDIERMLAEALKPEAIAAEAEALARGMEETITNSCNQYQHEPDCPDGDRPIVSEDGTASMAHTAYENRPQEDEGEGTPEEEQEDPYAEERPRPPAATPVMPEEEPQPAAPKSRTRRVGEALLRWMSHYMLPARYARRRYEQEHGPIANREEEAHSVGSYGRPDGAEDAATPSPALSQNTVMVENSCNQHAHEPGCTGGRIKGSTREGETAGKKKQASFRAIQKKIASAISETLQKGGDIRIESIGRDDLLIEHGRVGDKSKNWKGGYGSSHQQDKHPDVSPDMVARVIMQGKRQKEITKGEERVGIYYKGIKVTLAPTEHRRLKKLITAHPVDE